MRAFSRLVSRGYADQQNLQPVMTEAQERMATPPVRAVDLTVAKNRHGDTGKVGLIFRPDVGTMRQESTADTQR